VMIGIAPDMSQKSTALAEANYQALADSDRLAAERENTLAVRDEDLAKLPPDQAFVRGYIRNAARVCNISDRKPDLISRSSPTHASAVHRFVNR
jgi:hypothetical protein